MFLTGREIAAGLTGAWRIFRNDPKAMESFDLSFEGFWRSFLGVVLLVPVELVMIHAERQVFAGTELESSMPGFVYVVFRLCVLLVGWFTFPLFVLAVAHPMGIADRVVGYIIALNWCSVLASLVMSLPLIASGFGLIPLGVMTVAMLILIGVLLRYLYVLARIALDASVALAITLALANLSLGLIIAELAAQMI